MEDSIERVIAKRREHRATLDKPDVMQVQALYDISEELTRIRGQMEAIRTILGMRLKP